MKDWLKNEKTIRTFGDIVLYLLAGSLLIVLLAYAYIGTFSRYWADDFCFTQYLKPPNNLISATISLYNSWSNRYTTMLLVGVSEWFGQKAISYIPAIMIFLWVAGLTVLLNQVKMALKIPRHPLSSFLIALGLAFLTILQAPDRFQSVYWRSGVVTYFAPLVFYTFGAAFILQRAHKPGGKFVGIPAILFTAVLFFLSGGLSETTLAMQIGGLSIALLAAWFFTRGHNRRMYLILLSSGLIASFFSLIVVLTSPGNGTRLSSMPERLAYLDLITYTFRFSLDFVWLSVKALPIPAIFTLWLAALLSLDITGRMSFSKIHIKTSRLITLIILIVLVAFTLILCGTAPSVYVFAKFGYPTSRALLPARFVMTTALFAMGIIFGLIARKLLPRKTTLNKAVPTLIVSLLLGITILYPLKAFQNELASIPAYQKPSIAWDNRNAQILALKADHINDITLKSIGSPALLSELHPETNHWVNRCVARFYDLQTIAVFPN